MSNIVRLIALLALLITPVSSNAEEAEKNAAPFGLTWGMSSADARKLGVELSEKNNDSGVGATYVAAKLPKIIADAELIALQFGFNDKLWRVIAVSRDFSNDPYGAGLKERYNVLAKILEEKYGRGTPSHHQDTELYTKANEFLMGIKTGRAWHYTDFQKENISVQIAIDASSMSSGVWKLIFVNKPLEEQVKQEKLRQEKGSL